MSFAPDSHQRRRNASPDPLVRSIRSPEHERWLQKGQRRSRVERRRHAGRAKCGTSTPAVELPTNSILRPIVNGEDFPLPAESQDTTSTSPRSCVSSPQSLLQMNECRGTIDRSLAVLKRRCKVRATPHKKALVVAMLPVGARVDVVSIFKGIRGRRAVQIRSRYGTTAQAVTGWIHLPKRRSDSTKMPRFTELDHTLRPICPIDAKAESLSVRHLIPPPDWPQEGGCKCSVPEWVAMAQKSVSAEEDDGDCSDESYDEAGTDHSAVSDVEATNDNHVSSARLRGTWRDVWKAVISAALTACRSHQTLAGVHSVKSHLHLGPLLPPQTTSPYAEEILVQGSHDKEQTDGNSVEALISIANGRRTEGSMSCRASDDRAQHSCAAIELDSAQMYSKQLQNKQQVTELRIHIDTVLSSDSDSKDMDTTRTTPVGQQQMILSPAAASFRQSSTAGNVSSQRRQATRPQSPQRLSDSLGATPSPTLLDNLPQKFSFSKLDRMVASPEAGHICHRRSTPPSKIHKIRENINMPKTSAALTASAGDSNEDLQSSRGGAVANIQGKIHPRRSLLRSSQLLMLSGPRAVYPSKKARRRAARRAIELIANWTDRVEKSRLQAWEEHIAVEPDRSVADGYLCLLLLQLERGNGHLLSPFDSRPNDREPLPYLTYSTWTRAAHCRRVDRRQGAKGRKLRPATTAVSHSQVRSARLPTPEPEISPPPNWTRLEWQESAVAGGDMDSRAPQLELVERAVAATRRDMEEQLGRARSWSKTDNAAGVVDIAWELANACAEERATAAAALEELSAQHALAQTTAFERMAAAADAQVAEAVAATRAEVAMKAEALLVMERQRAEQKRLQDARAAAAETAAAQEESRLLRQALSSALADYERVVERIHDPTGFSSDSDD